jgi:hypothetical protein
MVGVDNVMALCCYKKIVRDLEELFGLGPVAECGVYNGQSAVQDKK